MPYSSHKNNRVEIIRNLQVVDLRNQGKNFEEIASILNIKSGRKHAANIYKNWKDVKFRLLKDKSDFVYLEDDKAVIQ